MRSVNSLKLQIIQTVMRYWEGIPRAHSNKNVTNDAKLLCLSQSLNYESIMEKHTYIFLDIRKLFSLNFVQLGIQNLNFWNKQVNVWANTLHDVTKCLGVFWPNSMLHSECSHSFSDDQYILYLHYSCIFFRHHPLLTIWNISLKVAMIWRLDLSPFSGGYLWFVSLIYLGVGVTFFIQHYS